MGAAAAPAQRAERREAPDSAGTYRPRRPQASPLYRLIEEHFPEFTTVYDERFARRWGYWRPVVGEVVEKFHACGILKHGFARVRCGSCKHEFLLAFSCKCRYFCPSCHAKRLALWGIWLEETLLAEVPHRQVVLTVSKRSRDVKSYGRRCPTTTYRNCHKELSQPGRSARNAPVLKRTQWDFLTANMARAS